MRKIINVVVEASTRKSQAKLNSVFDYLSHARQMKIKNEFL